VRDLENLKKEEAMARAGQQRHRKKNPFMYSFIINLLIYLFGYLFIICMCE